MKYFAAQLFPFTALIAGCYITLSQPQNPAGATILTATISGYFALQSPQLRSTTSRTKKED